MTMPSQPRAAISSQRSREKPSASFVSRNGRMRRSDERLATNSRAVRARSSCSSFRTRSKRVSSIRQAEHALGDDVQLDLGRAALDRVAARAQPIARDLELVLVEAGPVPAEPLRPADADHELAPAHVELGAVV